MRVVVAPDAYKGTLGAVHATRGGRVVDVGPDTGPAGTPDSVPGRCLMLPEGTGVVELAVCAGRPPLPVPAPVTATTRGLGEACARTPDLGVHRLEVALGGSASTDGGAGPLTGLGARLRDPGGTDLPHGGAALARLDQLDVTDLRPPPPGGVEVFVDVDAPLLGPFGAAAVLAPQKGATSADVISLAAGLTRWAALLGGRSGARCAGAAGGTGYAPAAAWAGRLTSGSTLATDVGSLDAARADRARARRAAVRHWLSSCPATDTRKEPAVPPSTARLPRINPTRTDRPGGVGEPAARRSRS